MVVNLGMLLLLLVSDAPSIMIVVVDGSDASVEGCVDDTMAVIMVAVFLLVTALVVMG